MALPSMIETAASKVFPAQVVCAKQHRLNLVRQHCRAVQSKQKSWKFGARDAVLPSSDSQLPRDRDQPPRDVQHLRDPALPFSDSQHFRVPVYPSKDVIALPRRNYFLLNIKWFFQMKLCL